MENNPSRLLVIKSKLSELKRVEVFVNEIFIKNNISINYFNKVYLCVSEAVVNCIKHGNRNDKNKSVSIISSYISNYLTFEISDEGEGFNLIDVKDPTDIYNIKEECGRGIHIIESLSEETKYNKKGNCVNLKIKCK